MANTYTQIYLHAIFAVSGRVCVISSERREELQKYITGIVTGKGQKLIAIFCMPDHTHLLLGLKPNIAPSDLIVTSKLVRPITSTRRSGSDAGSRGKKALARFPFRIRMWDALPITSTIS
jgi:REP element-mobilizing transposase RayT